MPLNPATVGQNIWLIYAGVGLLILGGVVLTIFWMCGGALLAYLRQGRVARDKYARTHQPDGKPYPPSSEGLCGNCHKVFRKVYYLPDGRALCPACYAAGQSSSELQSEK